MKAQEKQQHSRCSGMLNQEDLTVIPGEDIHYLIIVIMYLLTFLVQVILMSFIAELVKGLFLTILKVLDFLD